MIPVLTANGFQRFVTDRQFAAEVAGKVLPKREGMWRRAEMRYSPTVGDHWYVWHYEPKDGERDAWQRRPGRQDNTNGGVAH